MGSSPDSAIHYLLLRITEFQDISRYLFTKNYLISKIPSASDSQLM